MSGLPEVICSTSIERVVSGRNAALAQITALIHQLDEISALTNRIGGGMAKDWAMRQGHGYASWLTERVDTAI
ncbi:MAG: restriction endonuclease subunit M, partial [Serratia symbiotica]|nr:restriction endonuclease subunit M [Serratia symbiotica]